MDRKLYAPLNDPNVSVRTSSLKVLSRLILSDMLKVKGQISELAKMLVDDNENLSSLARLFFNELKKKENAIYNVLPDIISNLSGGEEMVEHKFQDIMKFLFSLIEKDRQTQCLVEKLCQRFRTTLYVSMSPFLMAFELLMTTNFFNLFFHFFQFLL